MKSPNGRKNSFFDFVFAQKKTVQLKCGRYIPCVEGFTLIEILITITILSIIGGIGVVSLSNYKNRHSFDLDTTNVLEVLRSAQNKAILGERGTSWGVKFTSYADGGYYELFSGSGYATSSVSLHQTLTGTTRFSSPSSGFSKTVVFAKTSGKSDSAHSIVLRGAATNSINTVSVSSSGTLKQTNSGDLVGYWTFDEGSGSVVYDASSKESDGILTNSPAWQAGSNCKSGSCLSFDGNDDYILTESSAGISGDASFSLCSWVKWTGTSWSSDYPSFMGNTSTGTTGRGMSFTLKDGRPALDFWNNRFRATNALLTGTWYHICATKTPGAISSHTILYVNGNEVSGVLEGTDTPPDIIDSQTVIGRLDETRLFWGLLDDVRIYNRALSATEIKNLYESY
jgi:prepilin-type N-terminal cleavage/methylation domain-containing protein